MRSNSNCRLFATTNKRTFILCHTSARRRKEAAAFDCSSQLYASIRHRSEYSPVHGIFLRTYLVHGGNFELRKGRFRLLIFDSDMAGNNADFSGSDFTQARFRGWNIEGANFSKCKLKGARLQKSLLLHAKFLGSDLENANLSGSNLDHADFTGSNLFNADFTDASLDEVILSRTNLKDTVGLPKPLIDDAMKAGSVSMSAEEFDRWNASKLVPIDAREYARWQDEGFHVDESGHPVFANHKSPENRLVQAYPSYFPSN